MNRTRVDGQAFQDELEKAAKKLNIPVFTVRLRTPQSRQANVKNISDFILFGASTLVLEAKETGHDSFSLNSFQQKEEVEKFRTFFAKADMYYNWDCYPYRVAILVHFIKHQQYVFYYLDKNPFKVLHPNDEDSIVSTSLQEVLLSALGETT